MADRLSKMVATATVVLADGAGTPTNQPLFFAVLC
jgi:hypothetical protein